MQEYLTEGKLDALHDYLDTYNESLPDDSLVRFCENTAANAVLLYFTQQAKENHVDYIVKVNITNDVFVSDVDISVLFGNHEKRSGSLQKGVTDYMKKIFDNSSLHSIPIIYALQKEFKQKEILGQS